MWKRIIHFVQYHNFFTIAVMMLFVGASASFAASPDLQQSVLAKTSVVRSVDNTFLVNTNFDTYDMGLKIVAVTQDTDMYYVDYTYNTIVENDYVWQPNPVTGSIKVSKKELAGRDLGLYVADQLGQVVTQQVAYLKDVQTKEREKGATQKVVATEYSGLVGRFLGTEEKTFEGYTPVKEPLPVEVAQTGIPDNSGAAALAAIVAAVPSDGVSLTSQGATPENSALTHDQLQALIQDAVRQLLAGGTATTTPLNTTPPPPADTATPPSSSGSGSTTPPPAETTPPTSPEATQGTAPTATTTPPVIPPTEPAATTTPPVIPPVEPVATTTPPVIDTTPPAATTTPPVEPVPPPVDTTTTTASTTPA